MKNHFLRFALFGSMAACGGGAVNGASTTTPTVDATKAYPIVLHRHSHVGDRLRVVRDETEDNASIMRLASTGKEISHDHKIRHAHLEGVMTTVALDARQDDLRDTLDVTTLAVDDVVVLRNKRIDITKARKEDDATVMVDGAPPSPELRKLLQDLLSLSVGGATDDDVFGTKQPQLVGAQWPLDGDRARADLVESQGPEFASTKITGATTFVSIKHVGNIDALEMMGELQIDGIKIPLPQPGATCEPGQAKMIMTGLMPVDPNRAVLESHTEFVMHARIHVPTKDGDSVTGDITSIAHHDDQFTQL